MQVHHGSGIIARLIERAMHEHFLGWLVAADMLKAQIQLRQALRVESAQTRIGWRHQVAIRKADTNIAGASNGKAACEQAAREFTQEHTGLMLIYVSCKHLSTFQHMKR